MVLESHNMMDTLNTIQLFIVCCSHYSMTSVSQKSEVFTIRSQRPMTMYCDSGDDGSVFERSFKTSSGRQKRNFRVKIFNFILSVNKLPNIRVD